MEIRHAEPGDYARVIAVVDEWWGGRELAAMLPKLFFIHFRDTSFVAEEDGGLAGFLCGFRSQTHGLNEGAPPSQPGDRREQECGDHHGDHQRSDREPDPGPELGIRQLSG